MYLLLVVITHLILVFAKHRDLLLKGAIDTSVLLRQRAVRGFKLEARTLELLFDELKLVFSRRQLELLVL